MCICSRTGIWPHVLMDPAVSFFMLALKVWTALSANPLVDGWYGTDVTLRILFFLVNCINVHFFPSFLAGHLRVSGHQNVDPLENWWCQEHSEGHSEGQAIILVETLERVDSDKLVILETCWYVCGKSNLERDFPLEVKHGPAHSLLRCAQLLPEVKTS